MLVREVMSKTPLYLPPTATLKEAATKMRDFDFGFIPVGEDDKLIGIVTDRDIAIRAVAKGLDPKLTRVKQILTKRILYCYEDEKLEKAAKSMEKQQVHRLIVLDRSKRMVGVITTGDVARKAHDGELTGEIIEFIAKKRKAA